MEFSLLPVTTVTQMSSVTCHDMLGSHYLFSNTERSVSIVPLRTKASEFKFGFSLEHSG
jgi:hypothetical protein